MIVPRVFLVAFLWRLAIGLLTCTFFQPDEFYQGLEVAHHAVFGYGHLTWEWTASPPIRSVVFPILYTPAFWLLKLLKWDESNALVRILLRRKRTFFPLLNDSLFQRLPLRKSFRHFLLLLLMLVHGVFRNKS